MIYTYRALNMFNYVFLVLFYYSPLLIKYISQTCFVYFIKLNENGIYHQIVLVTVIVHIVIQFKIKFIKFWVNVKKRVLYFVLKGTVSRKLRLMLLYIIRKLYLLALSADLQKYFY